MKKIVIVDDDLDLCETVVLLCRSLGFENSHAVNSLQSLKESPNVLENCHLILLDINLGYGQPDGLAVYRWLTTNQFSGQIAFFTGHAMSHPTVQLAKQSGLPVLEKPVPLTRLEQLLREGQ